MAKRKFDIRTPIEFASGKRVTLKIGNAWLEESAKGKYLSGEITLIPVGHQGPLRVLLFPDQDQDQDQEGVDVDIPF